MRGPLFSEEEVAQAAHWVAEGARDDVAALQRGETSAVPASPAPSAAGAPGAHTEAAAAEGRREAARWFESTVTGGAMALLAVGWAALWLAERSL